jgi:putative DNA primase/helicase
LVTEYAPDDQNLEGPERSFFPRSITPARRNSPLLIGQAILNQHRVDWLVPGHLTTGGFAILYGKAGSYKTFIALDLALAVSQGTTWCGVNVQQGPVVFVSAEGQGGVSERVGAYSKDRGSRISNQFALWPQPLMLRDPARVEAFVSDVTAVFPEPRLIVIDTLSRCFGGGDENSPSDMGSFVAGVDQLRTTGAAVLVIHHTGKSGKNPTPRGHYSLEAAADTVIHAKSDGNSNLTRLICTKQRDADEFSEIQLTTRLVDLGDSSTSLVMDLQGRVATSAKTIEQQSRTISDFENMILVKLKELGSMGMDELRKALANPEQGIQMASEPTVRKAIRRLVQNGFVEIEKHGQGSKHIYTWTGENW